MELSKSELRRLAEEACKNHRITCVPSSARRVRGWNKILREGGKYNADIEDMKRELAVLEAEEKRLERLEKVLSKGG